MVCASAMMLAACGQSNKTIGGNNAVVTRKKPPAKVTPTTVPNTTSPAVIAANYVRAQWTVNWAHLIDKQNGFAEWAMLIKPYVTPAMWSQISQGQQSGTYNPNIEPYSRWIAVHRMTFANILHSGVMAEAGVTPTSQVEQVTYDIERTGTDLPSSGAVSGIQIEQLLMNKINGHWLVAKQYSSLSG